MSPAHPKRAPLDFWLVVAAAGGSNALTTCSWLLVVFEYSNIWVGCCCCRRSTAICAAVCQSWHSVAEEDCLWQRHICYEFFRPGLLAYSASYLGGCTQPESGCTTGTGGATAAAAASKILLHATQQGPEAIAHHQPQPQHGLLKQLFSAGLVGRARPAAS